MSYVFENDKKHRICMEYFPKPFIMFEGMYINNCGDLVKDGVVYKRVDHRYDDYKIQRKIDELEMQRLRDELLAKQTQLQFESNYYVHAPPPYPINSGRLRVNNVYTTIEPYEVNYQRQRPSLPPFSHYYTRTPPAPKAGIWYEHGVYPEDYDYREQGFLKLELYGVGVFFMPHVKNGNVAKVEVKSTSG